jgi:catechol 2,3-dioxygenase-like lactoylglutathione lyase family enzyme
MSDDLDAGSPPVLNQINLVVRDMDAMVDFYRTLGVEVAPTPAAWLRDHRTVSMPDGLDLDLDSAEFARTWNQGWAMGRTGPVLGFRLPTRPAVDETYAKLTAAGHTGRQPPYDAFWGARYAVVSDPDGNAVGLMSPIDPARRTAPPNPPAG